MFIVDSLTNLLGQCTNPEFDPFDSFKIMSIQRLYERDLKVGLVSLNDLKQQIYKYYW